MRQTTLAILLLVISACTLGRANGRQAAESDVGGNRPYVWHGSGEDATIDTVNAALAIGSVAAAVALTPDEPSGPMCGSEPTDPPHTCPAKAGNDR
jgi:hypothetical protein